MTMPRFEVGIRVEGYAVGGEERHINSAFYIFRVTEENVTLPRLIADTEVQCCVLVLCRIVWCYVQNCAQCFSQ